MKFKKRLLELLLFSFIFCGCSINKQRYFSGYHTSWDKLAKTKNTVFADTLNLVNESELITANSNNEKEELSDLMESKQSLFLIEHSSNQLLTKSIKDKNKSVYNYPTTSSDLRRPIFQKKNKKDIFKDKKKPKKATDKPRIHALTWAVLTGNILSAGTVAGYIVSGLNDGMDSVVSIILYFVLLVISLGTVGIASLIILDFEKKENKQKYRVRWFSKLMIGLAIFFACLPLLFVLTLLAILLIMFM